MGLFDKIFGKGNSSSSPKTPPPQPQPKSGGGAGGRQSVGDSLEHLDQTIDLLEKKEQVLQKKVEQEVEKAKDLLAKKNKNGALQCMKRKKMYEDQITKIQAQKDNMETMRFAIQEQAMNQQVLEAQRRAGHQLSALNAGMNADKVEDDMDAIREAMDQAQDVSNALAQQLDTNPVDEDDLMAELEELAGEDTVAEKPQTAKAGTVPNELAGLNIPTSKLPAQKKPVVQEDDEEAALRALEAELNA